MTTPVANALLEGASPEFLRGVELERRIMKISWRAKEIAAASGLSRRAIAAGMGLRSPSAVQRILGGTAGYNATIETLMRFAAACGYALHVDFAKVLASSASEPRALPTGWLQAMGEANLGGEAAHEWRCYVSESTDARTRQYESARSLAG